MLEEDYSNLKTLYRELELPLPLLSRRWLIRFIFGLFWIKTRYYKTEKERIIRINLYQENLLDVPEIISNFTELIHLDLKDNLLITLPENIGNLQHIKLLDLSRNIVNQLPDSISNLSTLRVLNADSNLLEMLPENFGKLNNLRKLGLSENNFTDLPKQIFNLENLQDLDLSDNGIKIIPPEIKYLKSLKRLDISSNQIEELPEELFELPKLEYLNTNSNHLSESSKNIVTRLNRKGIRAFDYEEKKQEKINSEKENENNKKNMPIGYIIPLLMLGYLAYMFLTDQITVLYSYIVPIMIILMFHISYGMSNYTPPIRKELRVLKDNILKNNEIPKKYLFLILFDAVNYIVFGLEFLLFILKLTSNYSSFWFIPWLFILVYFIFLGLILKPITVVILRKKRHLNVYQAHKIPVKYLSDIVFSLYLIIALLYVL